MKILFQIRKKYQNLSPLYCKNFKNYGICFMEKFYFSVCTLRRYIEQVNIEVTQVGKRIRILFSALQVVPCA